MQFIDAACQLDALSCKAGCALLRDTVVKNCKYHTYGCTVMHSAAGCKSEILWSKYHTYGCTVMHGVALVQKHFCISYAYAVSPHAQATVLASIHNLNVI